MTGDRGLGTGLGGPGTEDRGLESGKKLSKILRTKNQCFFFRFRKPEVLRSQNFGACGGPRSVMTFVPNLYFYSQKATFILKMDEWPAGGAKIFKISSTKSSFSLYFCTKCLLAFPSKFFFSSRNSQTRKTSGLNPKKKN